MSGYFWIGLMTLLTAVGQVLLKWQISSASQSQGLALADALKLLLKPWVVIGLGCAFAASICWMMAISRMPLSKAYPLTSISLPLIAVLSVFFFQEQFNTQKILATALIMLGVILMAQPASS
jgi:drug/metabolite transporter (DMT)-like permease